MISAGEILSIIHSASRGLGWFLRSLLQRSVRQACCLAHRHRCRQADTEVETQDRHRQTDTHTHTRKHTTHARTLSHINKRPPPPAPARTNASTPNTHQGSTVVTNNKVSVCLSVCLSVPLSLSQSINETDPKLKTNAPSRKYH